MRGFATVWSGGRRFFWAAAALTLLLDQLTKWAFAGPDSRLLVIVPGVLRFIPHPGNVRGIFGLGPSGSLFYVIATVAGLALIGWFLVSTPAERRLVPAALGMLAGGAAGNLVDRLLFGHVRDFVDLHWKDVFHWYTFNAADAAICVGLGLILLDALLAPQKPQRGARASG